MSAIDSLYFCIGHWAERSGGIGHWASGVGHWALGIGHWEERSGGIGHWSKEQVRRSIDCCSLLRIVDVSAPYG
ncbi:hypothetical protein [Microcoleus sp. B4-D4]|uniref:hypothetical protein n=1 Tax=Microcoleus sp. B4-D4 TaxID=2818667 RepID=UPI002FD5D6F9